MRFWPVASSDNPVLSTMKCEQVRAAAPEHSAAGACCEVQVIALNRQCIRLVGPRFARAASRCSVCGRICDAADAAAPRRGRGPSGGRGWPWRDEL